MLTWSKVRLGQPPGLLASPKHGAAYDLRGLLNLNRVNS